MIKMDPYMMENGMKIKGAARVRSCFLMAPFTMVNGKQTRYMAKVSTSQATEIDMKVISTQA